MKRITVKVKADEGTKFDPHDAQFALGKTIFLGFGTITKVVVDKDGNYASVTMDLSKDAPKEGK